MQYKKSVYRSLAMVTQLGLSVVTPIFLCTFVGYLIDSRFGTKTIIFLLILGTLAGGRCAYVLAMNALKAEKKDDERQRLETRPSNGGSQVHHPKQPSRIRKDTMEESANTDKEEFHE